MVFDYEITPHTGYAVITLKGNLIEKSQALPLLEKVEEMCESGCCKWAVDFTNMIYMNSSGLNTLIQLLTKARVSGGEAVLYNMNKKISELILITKLHTLFKVAESKREALSILGV